MNVESPAQILWSVLVRVKFVIKQLLRPFLLYCDVDQSEDYQKRKNVGRGHFIGCCLDGSMSEYELQSVVRKQANLS